MFAFGWRAVLECAVIDISESCFTAVDMHVAILRIVKHMFVTVDVLTFANF